MDNLSDTIYRSYKYLNNLRKYAWTTLHIAQEDNWIPLEVAEAAVRYFPHDREGAMMWASKVSVELERALSDLPAKHFFLDGEWSYSKDGMNACVTGRSSLK